MDNPKINDNIRTLLEQEELESDERSKVEKLIAREYPILTAKKKTQRYCERCCLAFLQQRLQGKRDVYRIG